MSERLFDPRHETAAWIVFPDWDRFQHYKDRVPKWIKLYTELMADDEFMELSFADRGLLVSLWLEYASSRRALRQDTSSLSRRLGQRVLRSQVERLNHAGFIEFSAIRPVPEPYQDGPRAREEQEEELRERPRDVDLGENGARDTRASDLPVDLELGRGRLLSVAPKTNLKMMGDFGLPPAAWFAAAEEVEERRPEQPEKYVFTLFRTWAREGRYATAGLTDKPFVGEEPS